ALVSVLDKSGVPTPVDRALVLPPHSNLTPLTEPEQQKEIQTSSLYGKYEKQINRHSAAEELAGRERAVVDEKPKNAAPASRKTTPSRSTRRKSKDVGDVVGTIAVRTATNIGTQIGKEIVRGMLGSWLKKK
ncbi:MAG: DUF853 family protein, partial [Methanomicrobiales archaeon]|nr:DUF853 family protein [Methanomicrobiales archaeon]